MVWHDKAGGFAGYTIEEWFQDGTYRNSINVPSWFSPMHFAGFDNGSYLLLGGITSDTGLKSEEAIILDVQGKVETKHLFQSLDHPDRVPVPDVSSPQKPSPDSGKSDGIPASAKGEGPDTAGWQLYNRVATMLATQGGDGDVYLAEQESTGKVYRVSRFGAVQELHIDLPEELAGQHAITMALAVKAGLLFRQIDVIGPQLEMNKPLKPKAMYLVANSNSGGNVTKFYQLPNERVSAFPVTLEENGIRFLSFTKNPMTKRTDKTIVLLTP